MSDPRAKSISDATVADLGEFALIDALRLRLAGVYEPAELDEPAEPAGFEEPAEVEEPAGLAEPELVLLGPGDDAAVVRAPDGCVVISTDVLVDEVHFRRDWASATDIGRRAVAASLADIAAMGARSTALVVALACPGDLEVAWVLGLADGLRDEAALVGATIVGGDVARSSQLSVCVTALGDLQGRAPVTRAGARLGDVVAVCGRLGFAAAGLAVLSRGFRSPRALVAAYQRPEPPYLAGIAAATAGATAMSDVSDGLVADAGHIAHDSGVAIALQSSLFEVPEQLVAVAAAYGTDPMGWILSGGDDHALVATFAADIALPEGFTAIGEVVQLPVDAAAGETWISVDGTRATSEMGFSHFFGRAERS